MGIKGSGYRGRLVATGVTLALVLLALACAAPTPTPTPSPTPAPMLTPTATPAPTPQLMSFPFTWEEGGKLFDGSYLNAVEVTVHDFVYDGPSSWVEGYDRYVVHYSIKYTLYKEWSGFDGYYAVVGPCLEVQTDKGHLYGKDERSIAVYHLSDFLPGDEKHGVLSFDISPDERPVELRDYEAVGQGLKIAYIWQLESVGPAPTPTLTATALPTPTRTPTATPSPTPTFRFFLPPTPTSTPTPEGVYIQKVDKQAEAVVIVNATGRAIDMTGWTLVSVRGDQRYTFPDGFVLAPGDRVTVTSGPNAVDDPPAYLYWTRGYVWNNEERDPAELYDQEGNLVSRWDG